MAHVKLPRIPLLIIAAALIVLPGVVSAQTATVNQQTPAERCSLTQSYLRTIQKPRDLRARVDRLQAYRYIYQRLEVFVIRLEKNNQSNAREFRTKLDEFGRATDSFKNDYEQYDQTREALTNIKDCKNSINAFQEKLQTTRIQRQKLYDDVTRIGQILSPEITTQLDTLYEKLQATEKTRANNE
jgi:predicted DNA-binding protein YlxM (UPF0122 family)